MSAPQGFEGFADWHLHCIDEAEELGEERTQ